jgi:hypothetical protein
VLCSHQFMFRALILLLLFAGITVLALPFLVSSMYIDQRGVTISGRVHAKSETVTVRHSGWKRTADATIEYDLPEGAGVAFFNAGLDNQHYDALRVGQAVSLHYLRRQDMPNLPLVHFLSGARLLPTVRLADQRAFSRIERSLDRETMLICEGVAGLVLLLFVWRIARVPLFGWAIGICIASLASFLLLQEFPTPTPEPVADVRQGEGRVKSVSQIKYLFRGKRQRGVAADQPIDVVGIEFVPLGRTEPVVAVDLVDSGSVPGMKERSEVEIEYESRSPRTAYIRSAKRTFVARNIRGVLITGAAVLMVFAVFLAGVHVLSRTFRRSRVRGQRI